MDRKRPRTDATSSSENAASAAKRLRAGRAQTHHLVSLNDGTLVLINLTRPHGTPSSPLLVFLTGQARDVALLTLRFLSAEQLLGMRATCKTLLPLATAAIVRLSQRLFTPDCGLRDYVYYRHCWQRAYEEGHACFDYDRPRINKTSAMRRYLLSRQEVDKLPARTQHSPVFSTLIAVEDVLRAVAVKYGSLMQWQGREAAREATRLRRLRSREWREKQRRLQQSTWIELAWQATVQSWNELQSRVRAWWSGSGSTRTDDVGDPRTG